MTVRIQHPLRNSLAACLCLAAVLLAAGCSAAPPGATRDSPAVGPVQRHKGITDFVPFQVPATYNGLGNNVYTQVYKATTGTAPGGFHFTVKTSMAFWLNCIGRGTALLSSPGIDLKWSVPCGDGGSPSGITFRPKASAVGHVAFVLVTTTRGSKWEVRIDEAAPKGVAPAPDRIPARPTTST
jgi:hypothetical protein